MVNDGKGKRVVAAWRGSEAKREGGFGEAAAVYLKLHAVAAGVVAPGGEIADRLALGEFDRFAGGEVERGPFENLGRGAA